MVRSLVVKIWELNHSWPFSRDVFPPYFLFYSDQFYRLCFMVWPSSRREFHSKELGATSSSWGKCMKLWSSWRVVGCRRWVQCIAFLQAKMRANLPTAKRHQKSTHHHRYGHNKTECFKDLIVGQIIVDAILRSGQNQDAPRLQQRHKVVLMIHSHHKSSKDAAKRDHRASNIKLLIEMCFPWSHHSHHLHFFQKYNSKKS